MEIRTQDKMIETNGIKLHIVQKGDSESPLVLLLHGFPEFWYGWRQQISIRLFISSLEQRRLCYSGWSVGVRVRVVCYGAVTP